MSNTFGHNIKITIFGQSHSPAVGVSVDGLPAGFAIDFDDLYNFMQRRAPGINNHTSTRREPDEPEFLSGLVSGVTCGAPLCAVLRNADARPADYEQLRDVPRPSHADYTAYVKYGPARDHNGGGAFSGRLTASLCLAGGIILQLLKREGIRIAAHIAHIGNVYDRHFDLVDVSEADFDVLKSASFPVLDASAGARMLAVIDEAHTSGDSVGGIVECCVLNAPAGLGEPMFNGMENTISAIVFAIPGVKGVEFGGGFASAGQRGSQHNDAFVMRGDSVRTRTNNHGGILGGITSGMPIIFRAAFKPTPSIGMEQTSVDLSRREETLLTITGRHDPCIVPRAVPCVEAAAAIAVYDALLSPSRRL